MWFRFLHPQIPDFQILSKHTSMESVCIQLSDDAHISEWFCAPGPQLQKIKTLMNGSSKNGLFGNHCNKRTHFGSFIIACRDQWCSAGASEELRLRLKSHLASPILTRAVTVLDFVLPRWSNNKYRGLAVNRTTPPVKKIDVVALVQMHGLLLQRVYTLQSHSTL